MTSNLGAEYLSRPTGKNGRIEPQTRELVMGALRDYFLPEFLNRISSIVIFNRLTKREIRQIVELRLDEVQRRLEANGRDVKIECADEVKDYLGEAGYSPAYGARPLSRLIEKEVLNKLAILLLRGNIRDGEVAHCVLKDGRVDVIPNHPSDEMEDDEDMIDPNEALEQVEDTSADMDLYE